MIETSLAAPSGAQSSVTVRLRTIPSRVEGPNGRPFRAKTPWVARTREIARSENPRSRSATILPRTTLFPRIDD
jgi:hypothetical protein